MTGRERKKHNQLVITVATALIIMCLAFIAMFVHAANEQSFLVVFVIAFVIAIVIIFFTAKDMLK